MICSEYHFFKYTCTDVAEQYKHHQHIDAKTKRPTFSRQHFQNHFLKLSLKFFLRGPIDNKSTLVQAMARHWTGDKPLPESIIFKPIFLMKTLEYQFNFHWNLFLGVQLTISQHWFRQWLGTEQVTSHYLNQSISNPFFLMKTLEYQFNFHWNLFLGVQLTTSQHWFRQWLDTEQATSHYLNQSWPSPLMHVCVTSGRCELKNKKSIWKTKYVLLFKSVTNNIIWNWLLRYLLWNCPRMVVTGPH